MFTIYSIKLRFEEETEDAFLSGAGLQFMSCFGGILIHPS